MSYFSSNTKLLRQRKKRTQTEIAAALNVKRTTINALENSISQPTVALLLAYSKYFGIAIDTLINTDLQLLSESQFTELQNGFDVFIRGSNLRVIAITVDNNNTDNIEFVSEKAKAGYCTSFADPEYIGTLPVFQLPFLTQNKKYRAFSVSGDSMLPIPDEAVVIGEFVQDFFQVRTGDAILVVTLDDGIVFKIAENQIAENGTFKLISLNSEYAPFEIRVNEIKEIWKFVCYLNTKIPEPETDMIKMMKKMEQMQKEINLLNTNFSVSK